MPGDKIIAQGVGNVAYYVYHDTFLVHQSWKHAHVLYYPIVISSRLNLLSVLSNGDCFKQNGAVVLVPTGMHNTNVRRAHTNTDGQLLPSTYLFVVVVVVVVEHNVNVLAHTSRIYYYIFT